MCGRYYIESEEDNIEIRNIIDEINRKFADSTTAMQMKIGEIFPTNIAPVLIEGNDAVQAMPMKWGFPRWQGSGVVINARSETAAQKSMFRSALLERRIVIPTSGFYEWKHVEGKASKEKYLFREPGKTFLYLAGCYTEFAQPDGTKEARYTIFTTAANDSMVSYHDRMPVLLEKNECTPWIRDGKIADDILHRRPVNLTAALIHDKKTEQIGFDI